MSSDNDKFNEIQTLYVNLLEETDSTESAEGVPRYTSMLEPISDREKAERHEYFKKWVAIQDNKSKEEKELEALKFREWVASQLPTNTLIQATPQEVIPIGYQNPPNQIISDSVKTDNDREKDIREIVAFIKSKFLFVNFSGSLLLWMDGSYNPMSLNEFLPFCRRELPEKHRFLRDSNGKLAYNMLIADTYKIDDRDFENCAHYLTFLDGNYNVSDQQFYPHHPSVYTIGTIPVCFRNCQNSPRPEKFLQYINLISDDDPNMSDCIFEYIGYWISNFFGKHCDILIGRRNSGKSTFLTFIEHLIGQQYVSNVSLHDLAKPYLAAELYGKKFNNGGEVSSLTLKDDGLFKKLTGRDKITARKIRESPFVFTSRAKMVFCTNELENIKILNNDTEAVRKRINIIKFSGFISEKDFDQNIIEKFMSEKEGIVWLAINALNRLYRSNFAFTQYAKGIETNLEFDRIVDPTFALIHDFINTYCTINHNSAILFEKFVATFNAVMRQTLTVTEFSTKYRDRLITEYGLNARKKRINTQNPQMALIGIDLRQNMPYPPYQI